MNEDVRLYQLAQQEREVIAEYVETLAAAIRARGQT